MDLCRACHQALPWNDHACRRCALPLAATDPGDPEGDHCERCVDEYPRQAAASAAFLYAPMHDQNDWRQTFTIIVGAFLAAEL